MKKIIVLLLLLAGGAGYFFLSDGGATEYTFRTAALESGNIVAKVTATGKLSAVTVVEVGTQVSGTVKEIYADFNDHVTKNQVVATLGVRF